MKCPKCHGKRLVCIVHDDAFYPTWREDIPCDYCSGTGEVSCCEGTERQLPERDDVDI